MRRRRLLGAAAAAPLAVGARAQRVARIGILVPTQQQGRAAQFVGDLGRLGWQAGRNLQVEVRASDAPPLLDAHAAQLVHLPVDVIVAMLTPAALAAQRATRSIPIVVAGAGVDPVASGLVRSLAAPGGNVTGITVQGAHLAGKSLELVSELRRPTRRVGVLANATDPFTQALLDTLEQAARVLRIQLHSVPVRERTEYEAAFAGWAAARADAVFVQPSLATDEAAALALKHRLPSFSFLRAFVSAGGLLSYAASANELVRRSVDYVDRILRGADPAQLPMEQSTSFDLLLNLRTAKALNLSVPRPLLLRASEVIE